MPDIPDENYAPVWADDDRAEPPLVGDERTILTAFLDFHRRTFELKCSGIAAPALSERAVPPSGLSLHGLIRHLAGAERWWFRIQFAGEDVDNLYYADDDPNLDFDGLDGDPAEALATWRAEVDVARRLTAAAPSLEATGTHARSGEPVALRRILVAMVAEYARHNGHADLLRERIDGATGF